jgi:hypothetical protein
VDASWTEPPTVANDDRFLHANVYVSYGPLLLPVFGWAEIAQSRGINQRKMPGSIFSVTTEYEPNLILFWWLWTLTKLFKHYLYGLPQSLCRL